MKNSGLILIALLAAPAMLVAQASGVSSSLVELDGRADGGESKVVSPLRGAAASPDLPFSRIALGAGVSPLGLGLQATTNIHEHVNLRVTGNIVNYSTDFTTNGFTAHAKLNLASAGAAVDIYPFHKGFRISPGVLFYNQNEVTATNTVAGGTSFTLNDQTFYSARANSTTGATPVNGNAVLRLNTTKPAFTITAGWGNTIPRNGGHWSFPVEVGIALSGTPSLKVNLAGWACVDPAETQCTDISNPANPISVQIQNDLQVQVAKWKSDLDPLKTYPIVSAGVAYSFRVR